MKAISNIPSDAVLFDSGHVLFVEGKDSSIDVTALSKILPINVKAMGQSYYVKSVAQALAKEHPKYYFLIDRDHYEDSEVEDYWKKFPKTETPNLLIWRKKEIENYFLDPAYLMQSKYFKKTERELKSLILSKAMQRLFMGIVNQVIVSIREDFKRKWVEIFTDPNDFKDKAIALEKLLMLNNFASYSKKVNKCIARNELQRRFELYLNAMTGGIMPIEFGRGKWLDMLPGKPILHEILNSNCFMVKDRDNNALRGKNKIDEIIKELANSDKSLPSDFIALADLLRTRACS